MRAIDTHVHAWPVWPYEESTLDGSTPSTAADLERHLDAEGAEACWLIAADLPAARSRQSNNDYGEAARRRGIDGRIHLFVDVDSRWSGHYHRAGALARLTDLLERFASARGVAHYLDRRNDSWLASPEAREWAGELARRGLVADLAVTPDWYESLGALASAVPTLSIVVNHFGGAIDAEDFSRLGRLGGLGNIFVKVSGAHYLRAAGVDPRPRVESLLSDFGPDRLLWGSDFPVDGKYVRPDEVSELRERAFGWLDEGVVDAVFQGNARALLFR